MSSLRVRTRGLMPRVSLGTGVYGRPCARRRRGHRPRGVYVAGSVGVIRVIGAWAVRRARVDCSRVLSRSCAGGAGAVRGRRLSGLPLRPLAGA